MEKKTIPELRQILKGKDPEKQDFLFSYLSQVGRVLVDGNKAEAYQFPLWPEKKLSEPKVYPREEVLPFWMVISKHWVHQCFVDEEMVYEGGANAGFICLRCGIRIMIPLHSFVSVHLEGASLRGFKFIQDRVDIFEMRMKCLLGLDFPEEFVAYIKPKKMDPLLDFGRWEEICAK